MGIVYSTDVGRIKEYKEEQIPEGDGWVRLNYEKKGRKSCSGVIVIKGLSLKKEDLKKLCSDIKKKLGCGGSIEEYNIIIQGNNIEGVKKILTSSHFRIK